MPARDVSAIISLNYTSIFDFIIDKGTTDAILCSKNAFTNIALTYKECQRVLKTNGVFIVISSGKPLKNQKHFVRKGRFFKIRKWGKTEN